jgi:hypothetical protein
MLWTAGWRHVEGPCQNAMRSLLASLPVSRMMVRLAATGHLRPHGNCGILHHFRAAGERAEALFIAMAALVPTAGEHSEIQFDRVSAPEPPR